MQALDGLAFGIGIIGSAIIVWGLLVVCVRFLLVELKVLQNPEIGVDKHDLRQQLGAYILLGLEFMIAGDIIHTVIKPDQQALIVLGSIVAIRTVISFFLNKELEGKAF